MSDAYVNTCEKPLDEQKLYLKERNFFGLLTAIPFFALISYIIYKIFLDRPPTPPDAEYINENFALPVWHFAPKPNEFLGYALLILSILLFTVVFALIYNKYKMKINILYIKIANPILFISLTALVISFI